jgi:hypothetical protein
LSENWKKKAASERYSGSAVIVGNRRTDWHQRSLLFQGRRGIWSV